MDRAAGYPRSLERASLVAVGGGADVEDKMLLEERQNLVVEAAFVAPGFVSPGAVVFLCLVRYTKFVQLMGKSLIGINVILIQITAPPTKLEPAEGFKGGGILGDHGLKKKVGAHALSESRIDDQLIPIFVRRQIDVERRLLRVGQESLKDAGEDPGVTILAHVVQSFGIGHKIPVG